MMLFILLAFLILAGMCALLFLDVWRDADVAERRGAIEGEEEPENKQPWPPESLEGVLAAQRVADERTRATQCRTASRGKPPPRLSRP